MEEASGDDIHVLAGEAHVQNPRSGNANEDKDDWGLLVVGTVGVSRGWRTAQHLWMKGECWLTTTRWRNRADAGSIQRNRVSKSACCRPCRRDDDEWMEPGILAY